LKIPQEGVIYTDKFVSINVNIPSYIIEKLNKRQLWFLGLLQQNQNVKAEDIAVAWQINMRSAWRDITSLSNLGLIQFLGAKRTGKYRLLDYKPHA
jgi:Fic family protein